MSKRGALACLLMIAGCRPQRTLPRIEASAELRDPTGLVIGTARLSSARRGVLVKIDAGFLTPGLHGIHVHENGRCEPPSFESAGGHLNPHQKPHGLHSVGGPHAGDMPNLEVLSNRSSVSLRLLEATLGPGVNSLLRPGGTALIIHEGPDDQRTDPSGNSGKRVACGVIVRS